MLTTLLCILFLAETAVAELCSRGEFFCITGNAVCIPGNKVCDGHVDCVEGRDEMNCGTRYEGCPRWHGEEMTGCFSGGCIPQEWVCDGVYVCADDSDEANCTTSDTCPDGSFKCPHNRRCVHQARVCDGLDDCRDGHASDEATCTTTLRPSTDTTTTTTTTAATTTTTTTTTSWSEEEAQYVGCYHAEEVSHYRVQQSLSWKEGLHLCEHRLTVYAALQAEEGAPTFNHVYCGNDLQTLAIPVNSSMCRRCEEQPDKMCGGDHVVSLYQLRGLPNDDIQSTETMVSTNPPETSLQDTTEVTRVVDTLEPDEENPAKLPAANVSTEDSSLSKIHHDIKHMKVLGYTVFGVVLLIVFINIFILINQRKRAQELNERGACSYNPTYDKAELALNDFD